MNSMVDQFKTWMTVKLGTGLKTSREFRKALRANGCEISKWASYLLCKTGTCHNELEVELVKVTPKELGLKCDVFGTGDDVVRYNDICAKAQFSGLWLCPAEVGPQLWLQHADVMRGEWVTIGMEPISSAPYGNKLHVFDLSEGLKTAVVHDDLYGWGRVHPSDSYIFLKK